jgi:hypothetical protein
MQENTTEKQRQVGANDLGWTFHLYHATWILGLTSLFFLLDFWLFLLVLFLISIHFVKNF